MIEALTIQNFAGIDFLEIEVKPVTILIGPQASGKSICAKLLFYFRDFHQYIANFIFSQKNTELLAEDYCKVFEDYFPSHSWGNEAFEITYRNSKDYIKIVHIDNSNPVIELSYGQFYKDTIESLYQEHQASQKYENNLENPIEISTNSHLLKQYLIDRLDNKFNSAISIDQIFIPASRSLFSILQENVFALLLGNQSFDPLMKRFGVFYERIKPTRARFYEFSSIKSYTPTSKNLPIEELQNLTKEILSGEYIQENNLDFLIQNNGRKIRLSNASSGQQETLPLVLVLAFLAALNPQNIRKRSIYIEEPEAHIFPRTQKKIIELIALVFNISNGKFNFFITTHSPYILTSINNSMQAGDLYDEFSNRPATIQKLQGIISELKAFSSKQIAAYCISSDECVSIIDSETGLIDGSLIDGVSDEISTEFDKLLNLLDA
ncbi:MAG: AAA family ATPase [Cyanobacteria bacterium P01_H01_bin.105]